MTDVEGYLTELPDKRQQRIRHFMEVITSAAPELPVRLQSGIVGIGKYHYQYASGRTGEWFMLGIANRAKYISLYAASATDEDHLVQKFLDRLPGCRMGKACIEVPDSAAVDDEVLADLTRSVVASFQDAFARPRVPGQMHVWE